MASGSIFISKGYPTGLKILSFSLCSRAQKANYYKVALCFGLQKLRHANSDQLSRGHQFVCTPQPYSRECKVTTEEKREVLGLDKKKKYRNLDNLLQQRLPKQKEQRSRKQHEPHLLARKAGIHVEDSRSPQQVAANRKQSLTTVFQERKNKLFGQNMVKNFNTQDEFLIQKLRKVTNSPEPKTVLKEPLSGPRLDDYPTTAKPVSSFEELNIHPKLAQNLSRQNIFVPTEIQQYSILHLNKGSDIIIHSETGSGKTLAYLLPILQHPGKTGGNIIIVPSRELALQIHEVARSLLSEKKIAQVFVSGIEDEDSMIQRFRDTLPRILIGTPKALLKVIETNEEKFFDVSRIVLDEIDRLFLLSHGEKKKKKRKKITNHKHNKSYEMILAMLQSINNKHIQLIASTATADSHIINELSLLGWQKGVQIIKTKELKGIPYHLPECITHNYAIFSPEKGGGVTNIAATVRCFRGQECKSALVFIRSGTSPTLFMDSLKTYNINAVPLHVELTAEAADRTGFVKDFQSGKIEMAVATEDIVRGLDIKELDHVILTYVPKSASDYVHLAGRVGRQGRYGEVTTVISADEKEIDRYLSIVKTLNLKPHLLYDQRVTT